MGSIVLRLYSSILLSLHLALLFLPAFKLQQSPPEKKTLPCAKKVQKKTSLEYLISLENNPLDTETHTSTLSRGLFFIED